MRLSRFIQTRTKTELEVIRTELSLTDDEEQIFEGLRRGKSNVQIADMCNISVATVGNRIAHINEKIERMKGSEYNT